MRILKALTLVAVAGALAAGSAQAQATGWFQWHNTNLSPWYTYTIGGVTKYTSPSPYEAQFSLNAYSGAWYMPASGPQWTGPVQDIFCVDFQNTAVTQQYTANFTNLGMVQGAAAGDNSYISGSTRNHTLQQYLMAAYLSSKLSNYVASTPANDIARGNIQGAIWKIMTGSLYLPATVATRQGGFGDEINALAGEALANFSNVRANEWVVITATNAVGNNNVGPQEFVTQVTPEPATLLLLGTGLLTLMAAGVLRRSAV